jgi:uncharacterized protein (TIGR03435 family)
MRIGLASAAILASLCTLHAQAQRLEVASVKASAPPVAGGNAATVVSGGPGSSDPTLARFDNIDLFSLVTMAYGVARFQLSAPEWLNTTRFDINARIPEGSTVEQYRLMLQNLLAERFKLALHHETREMQTYELVLAKGGTKLKELPDDPNSTEPGLQPPSRWASPPPGALNRGVSIRAPRQTTEWLAATLSGLLQRPVTDAAGLKGRYDIRLTYSPIASAPPSAADVPEATDPGPSLAQQLQEQLGLKLSPKKGPVDVLVVDHMEKSPTED